MAKELIPAKQLAEELRDLKDLANKADDLSCVLLMVSRLEHATHTLLSGFLLAGQTATSLFDENKGGMLGTSSNRAKLAYCLGLISKPVFKNLTVLGNIRNEFAHSRLRKTFADSKIERLCRDLIFPTFDQEVGTGDLADFAKTPRDKFIFVAPLVYNHLILTALGIERREPYSGKW